jgi:AcrR family transcriptional regulator
MARTVKPDEFNAKRREILDAAQRLVFYLGYEQMAIQDILDELQISRGAFLHYFASRGALLEALVERIQQEVELPLLSIVHDPHLPALEKLQKYFAMLNRSRAARKTFLAKLLRVWYADDNIIVRQKVEEAIVERRVPLLTVIVRQGVQEGVFTTFYPDQVGKVILSLALGMENMVARLLLSSEHEQGEDELSLRCIDDIVATYAAYTDAIERVLGIVSPFLARLDAGTVKEWLVVQENGRS